MKKIAWKPLFVLSAAAMAAGWACAQTSSVQLYGIVDVAYRHTNNEGPANDRGQSLNKTIGGGMSQSRWGINVTEDLGSGMKALANLENRFSADSGDLNYGQPGPYFQQSWVGLQGGLWAFDHGAAVQPAV